MTARARDSRSDDPKTDVKTDVTHSPTGDVTSTTETTTGAGGAKSVKTTQDRPGGGSETRTDKTTGPSAECVVDDGTHHTGRAVPGTKVCSAHTFRYYNDGTPRDPSATGLAAKSREVRTP